MRSGRAPPPSPNPAGIAVTRCSSGNFVSLPRRGGREIRAPDVTGTYRIISGIGVRARLIRGLEALHPRQSTASIHREGATRAKANSTPLLGFPGARPLVRESERSESAPPGGSNRTTPPAHQRASCRKIGRPRRRRRLEGELGRGTLEEEKPPVFGMIRRSGMIAFQIFFMISLDVALKNLDGIVKTLHTQP